MRTTVIALAIIASPTMAQVAPLFPMPTPPVVQTMPVMPIFPDIRVNQYYLTPVAPAYSPQYIYRNFGGSALTYPTPDFALVPTFNGLTVYPTLPNSSLYDITKPLYTIK
jgi:hypothetical protein